MDFSVELVELLNHADVEGKKFTWNLQVNSYGSRLRFPLLQLENVPANPQKHLSPSSTRKRDVQRLNQWKAKRNQAIVSLKADTHANTEKQYN